jgi:hypothetical protein
MVRMVDRAETPGTNFNAIRISIHPLNRYSTGLTAR